MRLLTLLFIPLLCTCVSAQNSEFQIHNNGFIYPEATMSDLAFIVDSLDLKFKQCDLDRKYLARAQTMANYYTVENDNWRKVQSRLTQAAASGPIDVQTLYPNAKLVRRGILYVNEGSTRRPGRKFNLLPLNYGSSFSIQPGDEKSGQVTDLIYVGNGYKNTRVWVLDAVPTVREIPETYARMIQYVDCMVDTTQNIHFDDAASSTGGYLKSDPKVNGAADFLELTEKYEETAPEYDVTPEEDPTYELWGEWKKEMKAWTTGKQAWVNRMIKENRRFARAFARLKDDVRSGNSVYEESEYYLETQGEYALALKSKRLRKVWGSCSQDPSPRIHAAQIAKLSAASVEWTVFLRAHLNIMNDRFDRATDGNYALASRGTYLAEVEALGIDATSLLIGSCLEAEGLAKNHYQSNWSRVGRALTEAQDADAVVALITNIIRDPELDDLNRMTGVYLLRFMARNYGKEGTDKRYTRALATALAGLDAEWAKLVEVE